MKIPPGHDEASVLAAIEKVVGALAPTFVFGYFQLEDVKQQGVLFALEVLEKEKYDPSRQLENFLYCHIRNQFINLKRKLVKRCDAPCASCHSGRCCGPNGTPCARYLEWAERNKTKGNILRPLDLGNISDEHESRTRVDSTVESEAEFDELLEKIDGELPLELRADYLRLREGVALPKARRTLVESAVRRILCQEPDR